MDRLTLSSQNNYKVIQTLENGNKIISAVPSTWENAGKLMWPPPEKIRHRSLKSFRNAPGTLADGWTEYPCKVKRCNIGTYSEALRETQAMSNKSDTSDMEMATSATTGRSRRSVAARKTFNPDSDRVNFNEFLQHQRLHQKDQGESLTKSPIKPTKIGSIETAALPIYNSGPSTLLPSTLTSSQTLPNVSHNSLLQEQPLEFISDGQSYIFETTDSLAQNEILSEDNPQIISLNEEPSVQSMLFTMLEQVAKLTATVEHVVKTQEVILQKLSARSVPTSGSQIEAPFKRIDSIEDCHEFEDSLRKEDFTLDMMKKIDTVCGANCGLYGDNVAYSFADFIFTRRFFTLVTWTGISRGTEEKDCFQKFERIFQFFLDSVKKIDNKYTIKMLKDFFQKLISNSKRRYQQPKKRISRIKLRTFTSAKKRKSSFERLYSSCDENEEVDHDLNIDLTNNQTDEEILPSCSK